MILRIWRGREKKGQAGAYRAHLEGAVVPQLQALPGFMGATLLRREIDGETEVTVMTKWTSMEAIRAFAGADPGVAVVEPAARAVLASYDAHVVHHEVALELPAAATP